MKSKLSLIFSCGLLGICPLKAGPVIEIKDTAGRALTVELLEVADGNVTFMTSGEKGGKEHTLPIAKFDAASQAKIQAEAKDLKPLLPKLEIEVVVSKKRKKSGYYMVTQDVSATVKLRNLSTRLVLPNSKVHLTYFGRDRRVGDNYKVMARQSFDCELAPNAQTQEPVAGFKTSYDSDNRGAGNVGGYQYDSYLLVITDEAGNVLESRTSDAGVRASIEKDLGKAKTLNAAAIGALLNKELDVLK